ncbi:putative two-component system sensor kinase [Halobacteriovorax marinus SJ]|uniref:histidine kinase n=1 Tax=Halobacteriovorax marinus (strain ATCC BAA-682 / DSM 15412 / SJ) TaxID=862908 RepID=E1WXU2_HALMS|nr:ATP-binding protein [Halobacteriovorax marinus]CBW25899.1 putative two-component system sensor kinase [Halobacteriovorax marinus SJ]
MNFLSLINEMNRVLLNTSDLEVGLDRCLKLLATELRLDCVLIDKNFLNEETNRIYVENIYEWKVSDEIKRVDDELLSSFSYEDIYEIFSNTLAIGKPLFRNSMSEVVNQTKIGDFFMDNGLKSFFIAPIYFNSTHWGNLSLFDYKEERNWNEIEDELMLAVGILSSFFKNMETRDLFGQELCSNHAAKMATLGEMASGIAHEINNPLFVINGYASKIDSAIERGILDVHELKNISQMIQRHCKRVTSIISGLRLISRKSKLDELEVRNFKEIIESTIDISKERIRLAGIELINKMDNIDDISIECHPEQISQVIVNLLNNSYDSLSTRQAERWISLDMVELEDRVIFSLTDSGERIASEIAKKIMQPFFTTKDSDKGTGLGLSISKEIILKHGGNFYLDEHCENMRFIIELPKLDFE